MNEGGSPARRVALIAAVLVCAVAPTAHAGELTEIEIPARNDEIADKWLPGYPGPPRARVLLPDGYDPKKRYPLLVLLHGLGGNYGNWSDPGQGEIEATAAGFKGIIVMPEGASGWYVDWWNGGKRGDPSWESYHLDQVIPQVLERYRIRPGRRWHALAGVSMGGLGTAYLGGRLPGFFGSIAIISGLVDGHLYPPYEGAVQSLISQGQAGAGADPEAVMGPDDGFYSYGHDPVWLANNLTRTRVFMTTGGEHSASDDPAESGVINPASDNYAAALAAAGVDLTYQVHGGNHDWANFRQELGDAIAWGMFRPVPKRPRSWVNDTVATHGKLWEFSYRFDAPPDRIVRFQRSRKRLSVGAAGSPVNVTTKGRCTFHVETPAVIKVPVRPCK